MIDAAHAWTDEEIARLESELQRQYVEATAEMMDKQARWLRDYEAQKAGFDKDLKAGRITDKQYKAFMREAAMQRQWFTAMIDSLAEGAYQADVRAMDTVNDALPKVYAENANYAGYKSETGLGINTSFNLVNEETVRRLVRDNPDLLPEKVVNHYKDTVWNKQKFNSAILQGIVQGESVPDISKRVSSVMGMNYRAAKANARTALTAAENAARLNEMLRLRDLGIAVRKEWIATLDHRTRPTHRRSDNEVQELEERFRVTGLLYPGDPSTNDPGEVINCRCTMVQNFDGVTRDDTNRFSRIAPMTYEEWKNYHGAEHNDNS